MNCISLYFFIYLCVFLMYNEFRRIFMNTKTLNKKQWVVLIASVCAFIFGVLFCVLSQSGIDIVKTILSIAVLGYGIFYLISYCILSMDGRDSLSLLHAIGGVAVGVLLIFVPSFFVLY